jgi:uncharacterized membrane protein YcaP (DUF421 family)
MFFHSWSELGRIVTVSAVLFVFIVAVLRVVGQKALAKMSGYGVVVTITLGSIMASVILTKSLTISDAAVALLTLVALQEATRWLQARFLPVHHMVREPPRVVLWDGKLLEDRLSEGSVSADEVRAVVRKAGYAAIEDVRIVVLENDGSWSVVPKGHGHSEQGESALFGLNIPGRSSHRSQEEVRTAPSDRLP